MKLVIEGIRQPILRGIHTQKGANASNIISNNVDRVTVFAPNPRIATYDARPRF